MARGQGLEGRKSHAMGVCGTTGQGGGGGGQEAFRGGPRARVNIGRAHV
jgi:hypothetical protein